MIRRARRQSEKLLRLLAQRAHIGALGQHRCASRFFDRFEQLSSPLIARQHAQIGDLRRHIRRRHVQIRRKQHPPQPRIGIALRLHREEQLVDGRCRPRCVIKPAIKAFIPAVIAGEVLLAHRAQPGKHRSLRILHRHRRTARCAFARIDGGALRRQIRGGVLSVREQLADVARRGEALRRTPVVPDDLSQYCQRRDGTAALQQRLAVFYAEDIVRLPEHRVILADERPRGALPRRGKGQALGKLLSQRVGKIRPQQCLCRALQFRRVTAFAAKGQRVDHARRRQNAHAAAGKALRRRNGPRQRQLKD